jgi:hypothetical protein
VCCVKERPLWASQLNYWRHCFALFQAVHDLWPTGERRELQPKPGRLSIPGGIKLPYALCCSWIHLLCRHVGGFRCRIMGGPRPVIAKSSSSAVESMDAGEVCVCSCSSLSRWRDSTLYVCRMWCLPVQPLLRPAGRKL